MKPQIKSFIVTYDRLEDKAVSLLMDKERDDLVCYTVQKSVPKKITGLVKRVVNEWELPWNDYRYQSKQYYEYGAMVHIMNNPELISDATHIGLFHYDVMFNQFSLADMYQRLNTNPTVIHYQTLRKDMQSLYLSQYEFMNICNFMTQRLRNGIKIKPELVWNNGWVSEAMSVVPKDVFLCFANYLMRCSDEIESILTENRWGIMNNINHRVCGIVERMWGIYLVCCGMEMRQMHVLHDWDSYAHKHTEQANWIRSN